MTADLTSALLAAAMRACDRYGDGPPARADMERDCQALPPHLQADLLDHFQGHRPNFQPQKAPQ